MPRRTRPPKLEFDGAYFSGSATLPAWAGFGAGERSRRAPKVMIESEVAFDVLDALGEDEDPELSPAQLETLDELVRDQDVIRDAALGAVFEQYPDLRDRYLPHLEDPGSMPELGDAKGLRRLVGLKSICLHRVELSDRAYFGLILSCTWDGEHDLGVMMHGTRVVDVGGGDTAVLAWIAERDARKQKGATGKRPSSRRKASKKKAPAGKRSRR